VSDAALENGAVWALSQACRLRPSLAPRVSAIFAAGAPEKYSWLLGHGLIVSLVWLYLEMLRLLARMRD